MVHTGAGRGCYVFLRRLRRLLVTSDKPQLSGSPHQACAREAPGNLGIPRSGVHHPSPEMWGHFKTANVLRNTNHTGLQLITRNKPARLSAMRSLEEKPAAEALQISILQLPAVDLPEVVQLQALIFQDLTVFLRIQPVLAQGMTPNCSRVLGNCSGLNSLHQFQECPQVLDNAEHSRVKHASRVRHHRWNTRCSFCSPQRTMWGCLKQPFRVCSN